MILKMEMIGNLGKDAVVRHNDGGRTSINFSVAHTERWNNAHGQPVERTTWVGCTIWKGQGESARVAEYLKSGQMVYVEGVPSSRAYTSKDGGEMRSALQLTVKNLKLLGSNNKPNGQQQPQQQQPQQQPPQQPQQQQPQQQPYGQQPQQQQMQYPNTDIQPNTGFDGGPGDDLPF